jgi:acetyl esterase/lipase
MAGLTVPGEVQAVVDLYGPTDFLQMDAHMLPTAYERFNHSFGLLHCHDDPDSPESSLLGFPIQYFPDRVRPANPITYVTAAAPPFLIAHGEGDELVPLHQSDLLFTALEQAGVPAVYYTVPGAGHDKTITAPTHAPARVRATGGAPTATRPTLTTIDAFLRYAFAR